MAACFAMAAWVTADLVAHSPVALNSNNRCVHVIEELRPNVTEAHVAHPLPALRSGAGDREQWQERGSHDYHRGPFVRGRIIDLSVGAANKLGIHGLVRVSLSKM